MAKKAKTVHAEALGRFDEAWQAEKANRDEAIIDLEFRAGFQWDQASAKERTDDGRPVLTINRLPQFIRQVTGDARDNKPGIRVDPVDNNADPAIAELFTGLIRNIEQQSDAAIAYITAIEGSASCGIGNFRVTTEYSSDDAFEQDIYIRPINNPLSVYWDPGARLPTKEDALWCFLTEDLTKEQYEDRYPDFPADGWAENSTAGGAISHWLNADMITVAEYWCKTPVTKTLALLSNGETIDVTDIKSPEEIAMFAMSKQATVVRTRKVRTHKVEQYIMSGGDVLEGPTEWAGKYIPILPVVGEEVYIENRCYRHGVIRFARDPQRMFNYWRSAQAETVALQPKAPWLVTAGNVVNHLDYWKNANNRNTPFLVFDVDKENSGFVPRREAPPAMSSALANEIALADDDMKATTGIYASGLGQRSNETSGVAITARQRESDTGTAVYHDNLKRAIRHCGRILVDLIPKIYDSERTVRVLGEDDSQKHVTINQRAPDGTLLFDMSIGQYDVAVSSGPGYATRRMEAAESMMSFIQAAPQAAQYIGDLVAKNMDWPGADEVAERLRAVIMPGIQAATTPPQPPPPDPVKEADTAKKQAETQKITAETEAQNLENMQAQLAMQAQNGQLQALIHQMVMATVQQILGPRPMGGMPPMMQPQLPPTGMTAPGVSGV